jgi:two-component system, LytTR family, sensor kinase
MNKGVRIRRLGFYLRVALAWTLLWVFGYLVGDAGTFFARVPNELWRIVYLTTVNLLFFEYALPLITKKRNHIIFNIGIGLIFVWMLMMFVSFGLYAWRQLGIDVHVYTELRTYETLSHEIGYHTAGGVLSILWFGVIRHLYLYRQLSAAAQQLRIEKQQAELSYLKSQTNPHFLFNTLNNIYALARDRSNLAPESILRLSKILRFMLYETGGAYISIEQEFAIIGDYIALEKLRYDDSLAINFDHDIEDMKQPIPPLLLIPLVENAFKHGASETRHTPFVEIHLSVKHRQLSFSVKNSLEAPPPEGGEHIGLSNLRRQLELLYTEYSLSAEPAGSVFVAALTINLASHV